MKVLFTTFAARSHLFALVPLAWALQTAGHEVRVASQPDLAEDITRAGLTAVPVGQPLGLEAHMSEVDDSGQENVPAEVDPDKLTWDYLHGVYSGMVPYVYQPFSPDDMVDELVAYARDWRPDLVVWDPLTFAGPIAARASGAAHVRHLFAVDIQGVMRKAFKGHLARRHPARRDDPLANWLSETLHRYNCGFDEDVVLGQQTLHITPQSLMLPADLRYIPMRYVPYNGAAVIPDWLRATPIRPRICLTLGVSHREVQGGDKRSIEDIVDAVSDLDVEVVATLNAKQKARLRAVPANLRIADYVPLNALLPTCSAVISHGGSGTFHTAALHGVPQVIVPAKMWDEQIKAERLQAAGAGLCLPDPSAADIRRAVQRVLTDPSFSLGASQVRADMRDMPAPNDVVARLENLAQGRHNHRGRVFAKAAR